MKKVKQQLNRYFYIQTWGLFPIFIFFLPLDRYIDEKILLCISLAGGIAIFMVNLVLLMRKKPFNPMLGVSGLVIAQYAFWKLILFQLFQTIPSPVILGIILFFTLLVAQSRKNTIRDFAGINPSGKSYNAAIINNLYEFFRIIPALVLISGIGTSILIVYNNWPAEQNLHTHFTVTYIIPFVIFLVFLLYEIIRMKMIQSMLSSQIWLPIINMKGNVVGHVDREESYRAQNTFMHPHLRIIVICNNMLYLSKHFNIHPLTKNYIDVPVSVDIPYGEGIENFMKTLLDELHLPAHQTSFLIKTVYKDEHVKRLVYLYKIEISDETAFERLGLSGGKLWTTKQIQANLGKDVFSPRFEDEFDFLQNTILLLNEFPLPESEEGETGRGDTDFGTNGATAENPDEKTPSGPGYRNTPES